MASNNIRGHTFTDIELEAWVETSEGPVELELSRFEANYGINSIPTAAIKVAVGSSPYKSRGGSPAAAGAHKYAELLERRNPINIYAKLSGTAYRDPDTGKNKKWSADKKLIFSGYINRPKYHRGVGTAAISFSVVHWLSDLALSTKFSSTIHAESATDIFRVSSGYYNTVFDDDLNIRPSSSAAAKDFWKNAVKYILNQLVAEDAVGVTRYTWFNTAKLNQYPKKALERMDNEEEINVLPLAFHAQLADGLKLSGSSASKDNDYIGYNLVGNMLDMRSGATVWDTLLNIGDQYGFSIIPNAASATAAPLVPAVSDALEPFKTIGAWEYEDIITAGGENSENRTLPLAGVVLYSAAQFNTIKNAIPKDLIAINNIVGSYPDKNETRELAGQVKLLLAPPSVPLGAYAAAIKPYRAEGEKADVIEPTGFGNALAKSMYARSVFYSRGFTLSGRLRFDIAPGSFVATELVGKTVPKYATDSGSGRLWGTVRNVSVLLDSELGKARTSLNIGNVYTNKERNNTDLVIDQHPMYNTMWSGTELVRGLEE